MGDLRVEVWLERIDRSAMVACCRFQETHKGLIYGASTMVLLEAGHRNHGWRRQAEEKLRDELRRGVHRDSLRFNRHGMPHVGYVRDLNRA